MAIRVRCPRCWETAEVAEEHLGKQGKCNSCGALVQIPSKLTKSCFICGTDVTRGRHAKDPDNNYLCLSCFEARNPQQQALFTVPNLLECSICHARFTPGDGFERAGEPICKDCHHRHVGDDDDDEAPPPESKAPADRKEQMPPQPSSRRDEPAASNETEAADTLASSDKPDADAQVIGFGESDGAIRTRTIVRTRSSSFGSAVSVVTLLAIVGLAYLQLSPGGGVEDELRLRVATLKAQAEVLASLGRPKQAIDKYAELAKLVNGRAIRSEDLRREIQAAQAAAEQVSQASPEDWEQEHLLKIIVLRSQADLLKTLGHAREANDRYREIVRLAAGRAVRSAMLADEVQAARASIDRTAVAQVNRTNPLPATSNGQGSTSQPAIAQAGPVAAPPDETPDPSIFGDGPDPVIPTTTPAATVNPPPPTTRERPPLKSIFDD